MKNHHRIPTVSPRLRLRASVTSDRVSVRYIIVPPGIVAVPRKSPPKPKKRTPWHPQPDGTLRTERSGGREWFSDRLFVESQDHHVKTGYGSSVGCHSVAAAVLLAVIVAQPVAIVHVGDGKSPMVMPASLLLSPTATPGPRSTSAAPSAPKRNPGPLAIAPPPARANVPAPIDAPSEVHPETGAEHVLEGVEGGVVGGVPGGVVGALALDGEPAGAPIGPLRVGGGVKPPRKIKDVKPVFPPGALRDDMHGAVIIEATIDIDGKVKSATILHSVPALDRAALDAVRQWEYAPSTLDGRPVAVVFTVVVNFTIQ